MVAGMTVMVAVMTVRCPRSLVSRFRGNDGDGCGDDGTVSPPCGFPLSRE